MVRTAPARSRSIHEASISGNQPGANTFNRQPQEKQPQRAKTAERSVLRDIDARVRMDGISLREPVDRTRQLECLGYSLGAAEGRRLA